MDEQDEKVETMLGDPWLSKMSNRWPLSIFIIFAALFALKPLIINRLISRAQAYASYELYNNAERQCNKALFLDPRNDIAWNTLGQSYNRRGDLDNAIITYLNAINVNQSNKIAHFEVGMLFARREEYGRAIPHFEYIRSLNKETPEQLDKDSFNYYRYALEMLALCYQRTGNAEKAEMILSILKDSYPGYRGTIDRQKIIERYAEESERR